MIRRILVVNDDGILSPGIKILTKIATKLSKEVWVIAPENEQSASSHSLTLNRPLRIRKVSQRIYAVDGSPTDCVYLGFKKILSLKPPDLVLSGVNCGANLGEDVTYSGTIGAAMEGSLSGVRGIALSQEYISGQPVNWKTAEDWAPRIIKKIIKGSWDTSIVFNINFPSVSSKNVRGVEITSQGEHHARDLYEKRIDPRGRSYFWIGVSERLKKTGLKGTDVRAIQDNYISITPLDLNLTHRNTLKKLRNDFR